MQTIVKLAILLSLLGAHTAPAAEISLRSNRIAQSGLTTPQAKELLKLVLRHEGYDWKKRGMFIDDDLKASDGAAPHPGYLDFALGFDSPKAAATTFLGYYAVSQKTGDIWELNLCKRYEFSELQRAQKIVMERTRTSFYDERIERRGLGCPAE